MKPEMVNHGNVFKTGNWYTFYCPNCKCQLIPRDHHCTKCLTVITWPDKD